MPAKIRLIAGVCFAALPANSIWANPEGGKVVAGSASIPAPGANLQIGVASSRAIIDWQKFSISQGEVTRFNFESANGAVLNRVTGLNPANASVIAGRLEGNGTVLLVNPNGIFVSPTGVIDTRGFIGSTLPIDSGSFLQGAKFSYSFRGESGATIVNEGRILAHAKDGLPGGDVILVAQSVRNEGTISAPQGSVGLAAGNEVLLQDTGAERLVVATGTKGGSVVNSAAGVIDAVAAELKAAGGNIGALAINNQGVIRANTLVNEGGRIFLRAGDGVAASSGTLDATGRKGGEIQVTGAGVALTQGSVTDASGQTGGGKVLVGGGFQGKDASVPNADKTLVAQGAQIRADATQSGKGGEVVVWSETRTGFQGSISARGAGAAGGNAEVSSKGRLDFSGQVDLSGVGGNHGSLLLDPTRIDVVAADPGNGSFTANLTTVDQFADPNVGSGVTSLNVAAINTAAANVTLQAADAINFNAPVNTAVGLTAEVNGAAGAISVNQTITAQSLSLKAPTINLNAAGTTATPSVSTTAGQTYDGAVSLGAKTVLASTGNGAVTFNSSVDGAQALDVNTGGETRFDGIVGSSVATRLTTLTTDAPGTTTLAGALVNTTGDQLFGDNVTLAGAAGNGVFTGNSVTFAGNLNGGGHGLVTVANTTTIGQGAGKTAVNLASINASGTTQLNVPAVNTGGGDQIYQSLVLGQDGIALTAGNVTISAGADGVAGRSLTVNPAGTATLGGASKNLSTLTVNGATVAAPNASVASTGNQDYNGALTIATGSASLNSTAGQIAVDGNITGPGTLNVVGAAVIGDAQTDSVSGLAALNVTGTTRVNAGSVSTGAGNQTYDGKVTLAGGDKTFTAGTVDFKNDVDAGGNGVAITGNTALGATTANTVANVKSLSVSGNTLLNAPGVDTGATGDQTYTGQLNLAGGNKVLRGRTVSANGGGNGGGNALQVDGAAVFAGNYANLTTLTVNGDTTLNNATVASTGNQDLNGNLVVGTGASALNSTAGTVAVDGNVTGPGGLTVGADAVLGDAQADSVSGLASLNVTRTTRVNAGSVSTGAGNQTYNGKVTLAGGDKAFTAGTADFKNDLDAGGNGIAITGNTALGTTTANTVANVKSLSVSGNTVLNAPGVDTGATGDQTYTGQLNLAGGNKVLRGRTVSANGGGNGGGNALQVDGAAVFAGNHANLTTLTVNGDTTLNNATVASTGNQDLNGNLAVGAGASALNSTAGTVAVDGNVTGPGGLSIGADAVLGDAAADSVSGVASLSVARKTTINAASVSSTGAQTYTGDVTLGQSTALTSTANGNITFGAAVQADAAANNRALSVTTGGTTRFAGEVGGGGRELQTLSTDATGTTELGGNVTTLRGQTYGDDVVIAGNVTATSRANVGAGENGDIAFAKTVNASAGNNTRTLAVNTAGTTRFGGEVGNQATKLQTLTTDGATATDTTELSANVTTQGAQNYGDAVVLRGNVVAASTGNGDVRFAKTVDADAAANNRSLAVNTGGTTRFEGTVGAAGKELLSVATDGAANGTDTTELSANINTLRQQSFGDAVVLKNNVALTSQANVGAGENGDIRFARTVEADAAGANRALTVASPGTTRFGGAVGGTAGREVTSLITDASGTTEIAANVTTLRQQAYNDATIIAGNVTATSRANPGAGENGDVTFANTVNADAGGNNRTLAVDTAGTTAFRRDVGTTAALRSLTTTGGGATVLGDAADGGANVAVAALVQDYQDAVRLADHTTLRGGVNANDGAASVRLTTVDNDAGVGGRDLNILAQAGRLDKGTVNAASGRFQAAATRFQRLGAAGNPLGQVAVLKRSFPIPAGGGGGGGGGNDIPTPGPGAPAPGPERIILGGDDTSATSLDYDDAVILAADVTLTAGTDVRFASTVDAFSPGLQGLQVNAPGLTRFGDVVGGGTALKHLRTDDSANPDGTADGQERTSFGGGETAFTPTVRTTGEQRIADLAVLEQDSRFQTTGNDQAVRFLNGATGTGRTLTTVSDNLDLGDAANDTVAVGTLNVRPQTADRNIDLGTKTAGKLALTDAELDRVALTDPATGNVRIGSSDSGRIDVTAPVTLDAAKVRNLSLLNNGPIDDNGAAGSVAVDNLRVTSAGAVKLNGNVTTLAANVLGAGNDFRYTDVDNYQLGTVDTVKGITTTGTGRALLASQAGAITTEAEAVIKADQVALETATGLGTDAQPLNTETTKIEAKSATGGIFVKNTGDLEVADVDNANGFTGVRATTSGDIRLDVADKALTLSQTVQAKSGDVTLKHDGALLDNTATTDKGVVVEDAAKKLVLQGRGAVGTPAQALKTQVPSVALAKNGAGQPVGDTRIAEHDGIALVGSTEGKLYVKANDTAAVGQEGDITDIGTLAVSGSGKNLTLDAGTRDIVLDDTASTVGGTLYLKGRNIDVTENDATSLGQSAATGDLRINNLAGGIRETSIRDDGSVVPGAELVLGVGGKSTFRAPAGESIVLNPTEAGTPEQPNNFTGAVAFQLSSSDGKLKDIDVKDRSSFALRFEDGAGNPAELQTSGNVTVKTGSAATVGKFSQDSAVTSDGKVTVTATGDALLNQAITAGQDVTVDSKQNIEQSGAVRSTGANVAYRADGDIGTSASTDAAANLSFTAGRAILQGGSASAGNNATYLAGTTIDINNTLVANQDLKATAGGNITATKDSSVVTVGGTSQFDATATGNVLATNPGNDFGGEVQVVAANNAEITDKNSLTFGLGTSKTTGNLKLLAGGTISQNQSLDVGGQLAARTRSNADGAAINLGNSENVLKTVDLRTLKGAVADADPISGANAKADITINGQGHNDDEGYHIDAIRTAGTANLRSSAGSVELTDRGTTGATVEADRVTADVRQDLILGNDKSGEAAKQPANKIRELGPVTAGGNIYVYDKDALPYGANEATGFFIDPAWNATRGLTVVGNIAGRGQTVIRTAGDLVIAPGTTVNAAAGQVLVLSAEGSDPKAIVGGEFHNLGTIALASSESRVRVYGGDDDKSSFNTTAPINGSMRDTVGLDTGPYKLGTVTVAGVDQSGKPPTIKGPFAATFNQFFADSNNSFGPVANEPKIAVGYRLPPDQPQTEAAKFANFQLKLQELTVIDVETDSETTRRSRFPRIWTTSFDVYAIQKALRNQAGSR